MSAISFNILWCLLDYFLCSLYNTHFSYLNSHTVAHNYIEEACWVWMRLFYLFDWVSQWIFLWREGNHVEAKFNKLLDFPFIPACAKHNAAASHIPNQLLKYLKVIFFRTESVDSWFHSTDGRQHTGWQLWYSN